MRKSVINGFVNPFTEDPPARVVKRADISLPSLIIRSSHGCVGSSPTRGTCETSHVLLAGVPDGFSRGSQVFDPPTDRFVS